MGGGIPECLVHHKAINRAADAVRKAIQVSGTAPYNEGTHRGYLRYVQIVVERPKLGVQMVLVGNCDTVEPLRNLIEVLQRELGASLQGLFFSAQTQKSNAILGPSCEHIAGAQALEERIGGAHAFFPPDAFGQSHLALYDDVVARIGGLVPDGADVLELYAGVGAIGLSVLPRAKRVRFNELGEGSLRGLELGLAALPDALRQRTEVHPRSAAEHVAMIEDADVVIADPPRKGLAKELSRARWRLTQTFIYRVAIRNVPARRCTFVRRWAHAPQSASRVRLLSLTSTSKRSPSSIESSNYSPSPCFLGGRADRPMSKHYLEGGDLWIDEHW